MEVDNFQEFALMFMAGALLAVLMYAYQTAIAPTLQRAGIVSGCGCGG